MYDIELKRTTPATRGITTVLCILAIYIGILMVGQNEILAQDKSTSITCTGAGPCEKTECINGDCETISTNSSNVSSTTGSDGKESENKHDSIADLLRERLNMRED